MEKGKLTSKEESLKRYLNNSTIYRQLFFVSFLITQKKDLSFTIEMNSGSWTDGEKIVVGLPNYAYELSMEEILSCLKALVCHESEHIVSSNFTTLRKYLDNVYAYFNKKYKISRGPITQMAQYLNNAIEDGRIERINVIKFPGNLKHLRHMRKLWWLNQPMIERDNDYEKVYDLFFGVCSLATTGMKPYKWEKFYPKGTIEDNLLNEITDKVFDGVASNSHEECCSISFDILKKLEAYIVPILLDAEKSIEQMKEFIELFKDLFGSDTEFSTSFGGEFEEGDGEASNSSGSNSGSSMVHFSDSDKMGDEQKGNSKNNSGLGKSEPGNSKSLDEIPQWLKDQFEKAEQTIKKSEEKSVREIKEHNKDDKNKEELKSKNLKSETITEEEINKMSIEANFKGKIDYNYYKGTGAKCLYQSEARYVKKEVEKIFKNKAAQRISNAKSGRIDTRKLWKTGIGETRVYEKRIPGSIDQYAVYVLIDGSGSMRSDNKWELATKAASIIEEGFKDFVKIKIAVFAAEGNSHVIHNVIKPFDIKQRNNMVQGAIRDCFHLNFCGNRDGTNIRIALKELEKRNENNKMLIVLSDGMPTDYVGGTKEGMNDIKDAVENARRKDHIDVFSIAFGSDYDLKNLKDSHRFMYGQGLICVKPEFITRELISLIKKSIR